MSESNLCVTNHLPSSPSAEDAAHSSSEYETAAAMDAERPDVPRFEMETLLPEPHATDTQDVQEVTCGEDAGRNDGIPYDKGWALMVGFGTFINFALVVGYINSTAVFFVDLLRMFGAPATQTTLLFAIRSGVFSLSGMYVMNVIVLRLGSRKTAVLGAFLMSFSAIFSCLADQLIVLICLQSVLLGIAEGSILPASEVLLVAYFKRRRSLAITAAKVGASVGSLSMPLLVRYFLNNYGIRGALLLTGGVCLHAVPASLLLRPTSYYTKRRQKVLEKVTEGQPVHQQGNAEDEKPTARDHNSHGPRSRNIGGLMPSLCSLDFSLFRRSLFCMLFLYFLLCTSVNATASYLPALAAENGVSDTQAALLLSIVGGLDVVSRLGSGVLADRGVLRVPTMIVSSFLVLGTLTQLVRFMTSFEHFVVLAVLQGLLAGVSNCMVPMLVIEFVGVDNLGKGIGFYVLASGSFMAGFYPLLGYIRDLTGSYVIVYHVIGGSTLAAAGLMSLEGVVRRWEEGRSEQKRRDNSYVEESICVGATL